MRVPRRRRVALGLFLAVLQVWAGRAGVELAWAANAGISDAPAGKEPAPSPGEEMARKALALIRRAQDVGMPQELPRNIRRMARTQPHIAEEFESEHKHRRAGAFLLFPFVRYHDPELYRGAKRFWTGSWKKRLEALPYLKEAYFEESGEVQEAVLETILHIAVDSDWRIVEDVGIRFAPLSEEIENVLLDILERSTVRAHRESIFVSPAGSLPSPPSDAGCRRLMRLAEGRDSGDTMLRADEIGWIIDAGTHRQLPSDLFDYVLRVASSDPCLECRQAAIAPGMIEHHPRERVVSAYVKALEDILRESESEAEMTIALTSVQGRFLETVPLLVQALDARSPSLRVVALRGLERTTGVRPSELGYSERNDRWLLAGVEREPSEDALAALEDIVARWKAWWRRSGREFLRQRGVEVPEDGPPGSPVSADTTQDR
jgi:hypothetical protein